MSRPPTCPRCARVHAANDVRAVDPFGLRGQAGFRANYDGAPVRATREQCVPDMCAWRVRQRIVNLASAPPLPPTPTRTVTPPPPTQAEPRQPFPVVGVEQLARERAWQKFLAEAAVSLTVWQLDDTLHTELASPLDWLRECAADLNRLLHTPAVTA